MECRSEKVNKSRERELESDEDDFGLILYNTSDNSKICQKRVKFKEEPDIIANVEQPCTIDGCQYHTSNKNSQIGTLVNPVLSPTMTPICMM